MVPLTPRRRPANDFDEAVAAATATERDGSEDEALASALSRSEEPAPALLAPTAEPGGDTDDAGGDTGGGDGEPAGSLVPPAGSRRANIGMSRRLGLGPAYHRPLPEAIRLERAKRATDDGRQQEFVSPDVPGPSTDDSPDLTPLQHFQEVIGDPAGGRESRQPDTNQAGPAASSSFTPATEVVPDDVRTEVRTAYGVDVDRVHRGHGVSEEARRLGARAFARGGEAFIPPEIGRLDTPEGKSIVAHELTHVSQQRRTAGLMPREDTAAGRALEAEAQDAERFFRGDADAAPPSSRSGEGGAAAANPSIGADEAGVGEARAFMEKLVADGAAVSDGQGGIVFTPAPPSGASTGIQRQTAAAPLARPAGSPAAALSDLRPSADLGPGLDLLRSGAGLGLRPPVDAVKARNEMARGAAVRAFREVRLEHRKAQVLAEHPESSLSRDEELALEQEVQEDVERRLIDLETRVDRRLEAIMASEPEGETGAPVLEPEHYQRVVRDAFGDVAEAFPTIDTGTGRQAISARGYPVGSPADETALMERAGLAALSSDNADPRSPGGTMWPEEPHGRDIPGRTMTLPAADAVRAHPTAGGAFAPMSALGALVERAAPGTAVPGFPGTAAEYVPQSAAQAGLAGSGHAANETPENQAANTPAGVAAIGSAGIDQATVGWTGHEQLDLDHLDLDELSARIYGRLRRRLRAELLIDRERAGLLTDFR